MQASYSLLFYAYFLINVRQSFLYRNGVTAPKYGWDVSIVGADGVWLDFHLWKKYIYVLFVYFTGR